MMRSRSCLSSVLNSNRSGVVGAAVVIGLASFVLNRRYPSSVRLGTGPYQTSCLNVLRHKHIKIQILYFKYRSRWAATLAVRCRGDRLRSSRSEREPGMTDRAHEPPAKGATLADAIE